MLVLINNINDVQLLAGVFLSIVTVVAVQHVEVGALVQKEGE